jgi:hypothetical protein
MIEALELVLTADFKRGTASLVNFYLTHDCKGGWEGWLQAEYVRLVYQSFAASDTDRERTYPFSTQRCDLWFKPARGTEIWVELKAQRSASYTDTVLDFVADVKKIASLDERVRTSDVLCAMAVLALKGTDASLLNTFRSNAPSGKLDYFKYNGLGWVNVTASIATQGTGTVILATYRIA